MELTRRTALGSGLCGLMAYPKLAAAQQVKSWSETDALAEKIIKDRISPGLSFSIMVQGQMIYSKGFGVADFATQEPVRPDTLFMLSSTTKPFTNAAILSLAEDGRLSIDDNLARFIPEFPRASEVTLRHLMGHTSGLSDYVNDLSGEEELARIGVLEYSQSQMLERILATKPLSEAEPGARRLYSNSGFALLGIVIERVTGQPFAAFFEKRLFQRAGLTRTFVADPPPNSSGWAKGYLPDPTNPLGFTPAPPLTASWRSAAGAIRSTTEDLCLWFRALFSGQVIHPRSVAFMMEYVRLGDGSVPYQGTPSYGKFAYDFLWSPEHRYVYHGGGNPGFTCNERHYPAEGISFACMMNHKASAPESQAALKALRTAALTAVRGKP